jgi:hypothetical protein
VPVPRYHFNVHDGVSSLDHDGTELADQQTARLEAVRLAGEILKDEAHRVVLGEDWRIEVTDEAGFVLFHMTFVITDASAISRG